MLKTLLRRVGLGSQIDNSRRIISDYLRCTFSIPLIRIIQEGDVFKKKKKKRTSIVAALKRQISLFCLHPESCLLCPWCQRNQVRWSLLGRIREISCRGQLPCQMAKQTYVRVSHLLIENMCKKTNKQITTSFPHSQHGV